MYQKALLYAVIGVILNVALALSISPFATGEQIKPPKGAAKLDFFSQIFHMLVHHKQVLLTSSLIIFALVFLSVFMGDLIM